MSDTGICSLNRVVFIGCGTSLHAAQAGRHLVERLAGLPSEADSSSEFRYRSPVINRHTLVVSIGQSGETADTIAAMREAQERGARLMDRGINAFNRGLRAYYFGLALLAWFLGPVFLAAAAIWVVAVVYRRDSRSVTLQTLSRDDGPGKDGEAVAEGGGGRAGA